MKYLSNDIY
uniref:Uncharacterized protein n=1 Tax=Kuenenia stuttgartiensis TaxID=174633 RepID=Q1PZB7_KUEST|nr:unknown protein [Candidatus Kuenenia stuttgartiensis]